MPLGDVIKKVLTSGAEKLVTATGDTLDKVFTNKEEVAQAKIELEKVISAHAEEMGRQAVDLEKTLEQESTKQIESVNATMREEAKSDHWIQWIWRPFIGLVFGLALFNNWVLVPYFKQYGVETVIFDPQTMMVVGAILGVASLGRSAKSWQKEKNK